MEIFRCWGSDHNPKNWPTIFKYVDKLTKFLKNNSLHMYAEKNFYLHEFLNKYGYPCKCLPFGQLPDLCQWKFKNLPCHCALRCIKKWPAAEVCRKKKISYDKKSWWTCTPTFYIIFNQGGNFQVLRVRPQPKKLTNYF